MKVHVIISDVSGNGYVLHGVYDGVPPIEDYEAAKLYAARGFGGYQNTAVEECDLTHVETDPDT